VNESAEHDDVDDAVLAMRRALQPIPTPAPKKRGIVDLRPVSVQMISATRQQSPQIQQIQQGTSWWVESMEVELQVSALYDRPAPPRAYLFVMTLRRGDESTAEFRWRSKPPFWDEVKSRGMPCFDLQLVPLP